VISLFGRTVFLYRLVQDREIEGGMEFDGITHPMASRPNSKVR